jgi:hypothetical protein
MIHLSSEAENFTFDTFGGRMNVSRSDRILTPLGGLTAFASFVSELGIIDKLVNTCPVKRSSPNATPVRDLIVGFILTCIQEGKRFRDIRFIQNDKVLAKAFGVERRIPSNDSITRFFSQFDKGSCKQWLHDGQQVIYNSLTDFYILDWDSTVTTRYGSQEDVSIGYNPTKRGRGSHHPLICSIAGARLCLGMEFRSGDQYSSNGWIKTMEDIFDHLPSGRFPYLNRADIAFCGEDFLKWHESSAHQRPFYLFKLRKTSKVKEALYKISESQWEGSGSIGALQVCDATIQLDGWRHARRVVLGRRLISKESPEESGTLFGTSEYHYYAWVTNLSKGQYNAWQIADLYNGRADCENIYDELKNHWGLSGFCSDKAIVTEMAARFTLLSYNLWSLFVRFFNIDTHEEARNSRREFLLLPAQYIESGRSRYVQLSASDVLWKKIRSGYERLKLWLSQIASQLEIGTQIATFGYAIGQNSDPPLTPLPTTD